MQKATIDFNDSDSGAPEVKNGFLENTAFVLLLSLPFLLPIFFIPTASVPFLFTKMFLLSSFVLVAFVCWILARLKDGKFVVPSTSIILSGVAVAVVAVVASLVSGSVQLSLVGQMVDLGTSVALAIMFLLMFLVPLIFKTKDRIFYTYLLFFASYFIVAIFQLLRLWLGVGFMSFGVLTDATSTLLGRWNDLAIFFGVGGVLSLITLELISLSKFFKVLSYGALLISIFFLAIVNLPQVWYVLALFSLMFLIYVISFDKSETLKSSSSLPEGAVASQPSALRRIPVPSLIVLLISIAFIFGGTSIGNKISEKLNIGQLEVRPSWGTTLTIAKNVYAHDPFFGSGPNRFTEKWLAYKPDGVNSSVFWNTDFGFGVGLVPTYFVTTGLIGVITWLLFLGLFLYVGFKAVLSSMGDKVSRYLVTSTFLVSLFLWILNVFYIPGLPMVALTFFFTGLFIASAKEAGAIKQKTISFVEDPKKGFVSVLLLIMLLVGTIVTGYMLFEKFVSSYNFQKAAVIFGKEGNLDKSQSTILKAIPYDKLPTYYRALVQIDMMRMSALLSQDAKNVSVDVLRSQFQGLLSSALNNAQQAVTLDPKDYQSWIYLGQVYEAVVPLKIANAYESAVGAYNKALELNPKSPAILLTIARLEVSHGDVAKAKESIGKALQLKNNYAEAIFLLAQIQVSEGNIKDAIDSVQAASYLAPNDSGVFFQLGLLKYNYKDYQGAVDALQNAIRINPQYANAKYFLGLSLQKVGRVADAIAQFNDLKTTNPDNKEIDLILKNLNAGLAPFANASAPIDNTPEKRSKPPVVEKTTTKKKKATTEAVSPSTGTNLGEANL